MVDILSFLKEKLTSKQNFCFDIKFCFLFKSEQVMEEGECGTLSSQEVDESIDTSSKNYRL